MCEYISLLFMIPFFFVIFALLVWSLIWVYQDAEKRGKSGILVALLVFLLEWPISLLVWLVFRPDLPEHK